MDCIRFREQYSDFADGFLDEIGEIVMFRHMSECDACRRIDAAYRAGSSALRELPGLVMPSDFHDRLQARILAAVAEPEEESAWRHWPAGAVTVLALMALAGWQVVERLAQSATLRPQGFVVRFAGDSVGYPGPLPILPLSRDTFGTSARPAASFQLAVDYLIVP